MDNDNVLNEDSKVSLASSANSSFHEKANKKRKLEDFEIFNTAKGLLGVGSFGEVRLALEKPDGDMFAIKIMSKKKLYEQCSKEQIKNEYKL